MDRLTEQDRAWMHSVLDEALNAGTFEFNVGRDVEAVSCEEAGCPGCNWMHRKLVGPKRLIVEWPVENG